jgi:CsoR family transcriptional regulator, copper-sensing transcriptional repressor
MTDSVNAEIVSRLRSIEGHVRGIHRMVENGDYCIDIMNQLLAVQRAVQRVNGLVLARHLRSCVTNALSSDDVAQQERVIDEILSVFAANGKM